MPSFFSASLVLCLVAVVAACGDNHAPAILSPGSGPANEGPLWTARPGPMLPVDLADRPPTYAMTEDRMIGDRRVFAAGWRNPTPFFETGLGPAEPYFVRFYGRHDDGIYLEGDTREGLYEAPVLWIPKTVRLGMRWSHPPRWQFEVVQRSEGTPVSWTIAVTDARRRITNDSNTEVIIGEPYALEYLEGSQLPPFWKARSPSNGPFPGLLELDEVPAPADPVAVPELLLKPLNGGEPVADALVPSYFGIVADPDGDRLDITVDGQMPVFQRDFWIAVDTTFCGRYSVSADRLVELPEGPNMCRDARGTVIDAQGKVLSIGNNRWRRFRYCRPVTGTGFGNITCEPENERMAGIFRDADGTAKVFRETLGRLQLAPHIGDEVTPMGYYGALVEAEWTSLLRFPAGNDVGSDLWLPEPDATGWKLMAIKQNGLLTSHLRSDGLIDGHASMMDEGGNLGVGSDAAGRRVLRTHPDGLIERVVWSDDGINLARQPLGRIGLSADRVLVGAAEVGGRLLVLTLGGYEGNDAQYSPPGTRKGNVIKAGAERAEKPNLGQLRLWEAALPASPPPAVPTPLMTRLAFTSNPQFSDGLLCGAPDDTPLEGWSFGGVPAIAFWTDHSDCITLASDKRPTKTALGAFRGVVPGLGAFTATLGGNDWRFDLSLPGDDMFAGALPLADGSGFGACQHTDVDTEQCVAWRRFDHAWKIVASDLTAAPEYAPMEDEAGCSTFAGATCTFAGGGLLDCRGAGAPGLFLLPPLKPYTTVGPTTPNTAIYSIETCFPVGDTLWLYLREGAGQYHTFLKADTKAWTYETIPFVVSGYAGAIRRPEGDRALVFNDALPIIRDPGEQHPTAYVLLHEDAGEHFNIDFGHGGIAFHGPLLFGAEIPGIQGENLRRVWRPDLYQERLAGCGDGVLMQDEFCPEDRLCVPEQPPTCDPDYPVSTPCATSLCDPKGPVTTCSDDGLVLLRRDCAALCEGGSCFAIPFHCEAGACVPNTKPCGELACAPGESCFQGDNGVGLSCTVLPRCGDGVCESEEVGSDCADCPPRGAGPFDGLCTWAERWGDDCAQCGDGRCNAREDTRCPEDCVGCGDGVCAPGERDRCPGDCPGCGNGLCEVGERLEDLNDPYCPLDCAPCEADRPGCFKEGVIACDASGAVTSYTPCLDGDLCVGGACIAAGVCGNGRCELGEDESCGDCHPDACALNPCAPGVVCSSVPAPGTGRTCGACPSGQWGDGATCETCKAVARCDGALSCTNTTDSVCGGCAFGFEQLAPGADCTQTATVTFNPLNFNGMTGYPIDLDANQYCGATTAQEELDALCQLAGRTRAVDWTSSQVSVNTCYCWGACSDFAWRSNCCGGQATLPVITSITCE